MPRFLLVASSVAITVFASACDGVRETPRDPAPAQVGKVERKRANPDLRRTARLTADLKGGDRVQVDVAAERLVCGADLESLCYLAGHALTWEHDLPPEVFRPDAEPAQRRLAEMYVGGKLVPVKNGTVGVVVEKPGESPIDRSAIQRPDTVVKWVKVRFEGRTVFAPVTALEKQ
jgi:hypothetical protein